MLLILVACVVKDDTESLCSDPCADSAADSDAADTDSAGPHDTDSGGGDTDSAEDSAPEVIYGGVPDTSVAAARWGGGVAYDLALPWAGGGPDRGWPGGLADLG